VKKGSLALAVMVAISGFLRLTGPGATSSAPRTAEVSPKKNEIPTRAVSWYQHDFDGMVQGFCGESSRCLQAHFVVAVLPDPVHTHLALVFDRSIEALQQAAQRQGYEFDRSILPWDRTPHQDTDLEKRQKELQEQAIRESQPGLLIFREGLSRWRGRESLAAAARLKDPNAPAPAPHEEPLFVLVVGETPTAGLRTKQFQQALGIMKKIRGKSAGKGNPLLILGPTFSGSLESLKSELLQDHDPGAFPDTFVYSGTITDADSMNRFAEPPAPAAQPLPLHFASFQENDDYVRDQFIQFACSNDYSAEQIAILSEDETVFGGQNSSETPTKEKLEACAKDNRGGPQDVVHLHFPREISYFRSAYQKEVVGQQKPDAAAPGASTLPLDLGETGNDDDSVSPFASTLTPLSQEAVMLGVLSELQKHHIKFTILYATDPADQLFLARYLRTGYPQGRVVITAPDLLLSREEDALLRGVLGISAYALVPGLKDRLCHWEVSDPIHEDQLFVSSLSIGTFNAMIGLLSLEGQHSGDAVPSAPYAEYGTPALENPSGSARCGNRPLLWVTILGRDGFWPITAITAEHLIRSDRHDPIAYLSLEDAHQTSLKPADSPLSAPQNELPHIPGAWKVAYCLCFVFFVIHAFLSCSGSILADSEARTQFASTDDWRDAVIVALGALALVTVFVVLLFTESPTIIFEQPFFRSWTGSMWLPFLLFVSATLWDLGKRREQPWVAIAFALSLCLMVGWQVLAWFPLSIEEPDSHWRFFQDEKISVYWSTRVLHITSGVSPVLPVLLLLAAGYWWMWQSLRGISLVDLRRPRLPLKKDLGPFSYRLSEIEANQLRSAAHPFVLVWQVWIPIAVLLGGALVTVLDLGHPVQTMEGAAYDWGYTLLLALMIAGFLACLLKLVCAWSKCREVLAALDRLPLREAFSRMKRLSWHSMWNPGGSTLRETYKLMSRGIENLTRLKSLSQDWSTPLTDGVRWKVIAQIEKITKAREELLAVYGTIAGEAEETTRTGGTITAFFSAINTFPSYIRERYAKNRERGTDLKLLMQKIETLQGEMAKMAAVLIADVLKPLWDAETALVVSEDEKVPKVPLSPFRALAEEYAALTYVNFLVTVLLRMRTMVINAIGIYVLIVISMNVYPFEPHPALQTLAIVLLASLGAAVGVVYAEMHREAILSRLTSTGTGELGWDFWLKLLSAGAIPVFSLLAVQFPQINQFLFSWLEPALQAVK